MQCQQPTTSLIIQEYSECDLRPATRGDHGGRGPANCKHTYNSSLPLAPANNPQVFIDGLCLLRWEAWPYRSHSILFKWLEEPREYVPQGVNIGIYKTVGINSNFLQRLALHSTGQDPRQDTYPIVGQASDENYGNIFVLMALHVCRPWD